MPTKLQTPGAPSTISGQKASRLSKSQRRMAAVAKNSELSIPEPRSSLWFPAGWVANGSTQAIYTGATITVTGTNNAWGWWCNENITTGATTAATTWNLWVSPQVGTATSAYLQTQVVWGNWHNEHETYLQRLRRMRGEQQAQERLRLENAERLEKVMAAKTRARALLVEHLSQAQRAMLEERGYFEVQVSGRTYRIRNGTHGNVRLVENGIEKVSYCIQPHGVPEGDVMLAQKLDLETNEPEFLRIANARALVLP